MDTTNGDFILASIASAAAPPAPFGSRFAPYGALHAAVVATLIAGAVALSILRRRRPGAGPRLDRLLGGSALAIWIAYCLYALLPGVRSLDYSLPLQVCNLSGLAAALSLLLDRRWPRSILYFWGLGLSSTAIVMPDLHEGPRSPKFWLFWLSHGAIIGAALYDLYARQFRPVWKDFKFSVISAALYVAAIAPFDAFTGCNYGYLGRSRPGQPAILDALGPWPWRLGSMAALALLVFTLLLLPWRPRRRNKKPGGSRLNRSPVTTDQ